MSSAQPSGSEPQLCHLFFIRHGETVDNIAGLYAGVRNSALTNHGVQQAARLGNFFFKSNVLFTHIFSSDLDRAFKTAEAIRDTQLSSFSPEHTKGLKIVKLPLLQEQDFGYYEGKPFNASPPRFDRSSRGTLRDEDAEFKDMETKESMNKRANAFLDEYLIPALTLSVSDSKTTIAVVSHGITLSVLWRCFLKRLPPKSITLDALLLADQRPISLEHLGGWANTGVLELQLCRPAAAKNVSELAPGNEVVVPVESCPMVTEDLGLGENNDDMTTYDQPKHVVLSGWKTEIKKINSKEHLIGLKRTGGGVGSAKYDANQASIENFFKKKRHE